MESIISTPTTPTRAHLTPGRPSLVTHSNTSLPQPFDPSVIQKLSVHTLVFRSLKRTHDLFLSNHGELPPIDENVEKSFLSIKARDEYFPVMHLVENDEKTNKAKTRKTDANSNEAIKSDTAENGSHEISVPTEETEFEKIPIPPSSVPTPTQSNALVVSSGNSLLPRKANIMPKPEWHPPWKLMRVISGHNGWVRCLAVEPGNEWFASGSNDRIIKIWDLASGKLKLSLTGHISGVRGLAISSRQPYLFSCGEDKTVKCWDLEYNKVIRHYHGHLSGVYCIAIHPTIDILITGGRDSCARVWDMRTKAQIHALSGHSNTIASVQCQATEPQVITGSHDTTIRLWDLVAGKTRVTLTHHKKSVRAVEIHPKLNMFVSGAPDNIKQWRCPDGKFVQNLSGHNAIVNCLAINQDNVLVSGGDNGTMFFWDWRTGYNFQRTQAPPQPGSIESESGIFEMVFDQSGARLITGEADKTIKIYKEDEEANEETHPINWKPDLAKRVRY
ncbi:Pleiotropic regulator 1-like protein [Dinothrombium tinctorium]|uniref:Pleiotropic regulator 1 n=1 Tax=Dinothrombium tinctorium TaxID=1965070 RepID=A0A443R7H2_9ACAR|nr:Pleiotropic regulator 1-like protein [Dinothrombium tinctorium]